MIEAVEQINVNPQINATIIKSLKDFSTKMQNHLGSSGVHALIFLDTKLLSWFSTRGAIQLNSVDLLFLTLLCQRVGGRRHEVTQIRQRTRTTNSTTDSAERGHTSSSATGGFEDISSPEEHFTLEDTLGDETHGKPTLSFMTPSKINSNSIGSHKSKN